MDHPPFGQPFDFFADVITFVLQCFAWVITFPFLHFWIFLGVVGLFIVGGLIYSWFAEPDVVVPGPSSDPRPVDTASAVTRQRQLDEITSFSEAVIAVDQNNVLN